MVNNIDNTLSATTTATYTSLYHRNDKQHTNNQAETTPADRVYNRPIRLFDLLIFVAALWPKQYYPLPQPTNLHDNGLTMADTSPHSKDSNNCPTTTMTSLAAASQARPSGAASVDTPTSKGHIVHLLVKANTPPNIEFPAQQTTRNVMNLIKSNDPKCVFLNKNKDGVNSTDDIGTATNEFTQFATYKTIRISNGRLQHRVFFTVRLSVPFWQIKNEDCIEALKQQRVFLEQKSFCSTNYVELGWFARVHPSINWTEELKDKYRVIVATILKQEPPPFDLIKRPKKFGNNKRIETQSFVLECAKEDADTLTDVFISPDFQKATGALFIPANLLKNFGQTSYHLVLTDHTLYCNRTQTMLIHGLKLDLLNMEDADGNYPIYDLLVDVEKGIDIHRTARSIEIGKFLISFPSGQEEFATQKFNDVCQTITDLDIATEHPQLLFNGQLPRIGQAPTTFANKKLNAYATDLCGTITTGNGPTDEDKPSLITLNRGRRYTGSDSPSFQSMLTGDSPSQHSMASTWSLPTQKTQIDKLEQDVIGLHRQLEQIIGEQRQTATRMETKIDTKLQTSTPQRTSPLQLSLALILG